MRNERPAQLPGSSEFDDEVGEVRRLSLSGERAGSAVSAVDGWGRGGAWVGWGWSGVAWAGGFW